MMGLSESIDVLNPGDMNQLLDLVNSVGWRLTFPQAKLLFSVGTFYGHKLDGQLISSAAVFQYGSGFASIGMVMVHPHFQHKRLGRSIVKHCIIKMIDARSPVTLVSTDAGFPLYTSLGFKTVGRIHRFQIDEPTHVVHGNQEHNIALLDVSDAEKVFSLDRLVLEADRSRLLSALIADRNYGYVIYDGANNVTGFAIAVQKENVLVIGPVVAASVGDAIHLVEGFLSSWQGSIRLDVPGNQIQFISGLQRLGFRERLTSPMMVLNGHKLPGNRNRLYAITDPALG